MSCNLRTLLLLESPGFDPQRRKKIFKWGWPENTNLRGAITVQLTSCLFCSDSATLYLLNEQQCFACFIIQISQTGGQLYS